MTGAPRAELVRDLLARDGGAWVRCAGGSMLPTIARGERLRVVPARRARPGEVVLLRVGGELVVHRVVARLPAPGGAVVIHAGDATGRSGAAPEAAVVGRVLARRVAPPLGRRVAAVAAALGRVVSRRLAAVL